MRQKRYKRMLELGLLPLLLFIGFVPALAGSVPEAPVKGMVTMVDLGARKCIPCKMMAPILEKLKKDYEGKAAIVFIDVWKHRDQAERFGVGAIPTQIFYDKEGNEVHRHVGFMGEADIVKQLRAMGVD